jgi:hypothetical protein
MKGVRAAGIGLCLAGMLLPIPGVHAEPPARPAFRQSSADDDALFWRAVGAFALASAAAGGMVLAIKRFGLPTLRAGRREPALRRVETLRLSQRTNLHLISYRGQELLLAEGERGVERVGWPEEQ